MKRFKKILLKYRIRRYIKKNNIYFVAVKTVGELNHVSEVLGHKWSRISEVMHVGSIKSGLRVLVSLRKPYALNELNKGKRKSISYYKFKKTFKL